MSTKETKPATETAPTETTPQAAPVAPAEPVHDTLTVEAMTHETLKLHCTKLEELLHTLLRMGQRVYSDFRGTKEGEAFCEAVRLVGDEGLRRRVEISGPAAAHLDRE